jgi:hypothetical protein
MPFFIQDGSYNDGKLGQINLLYFFSTCQVPKLYVDLPNEQHNWSKMSQVTRIKITGTTYYLLSQNIQIQIYYTDLQLIEYNPKDRTND